MMCVCSMHCSNHCEVACCGRNPAPCPCDCHKPTDRVCLFTNDREESIGADQVMIDAAIADEREIRLAVLAGGG